PARELEILGNSPVEIKACMKIVRISRFESVAEFVEAFFVESGSGRFRLAPVAGRHVWPLCAYLQLAVVRHELRVIAGHGQPDMAGAAGTRIDRHEERTAFGRPPARQHRPAN